MPYFDEQEYISLNDKYLENVMDVAGARLTQPQLTVVKLFIMKVPKPTVNSWLINVNVSLELPYIDWCQYKSNWLS